MRIIRIKCETAKPHQTKSKQTDLGSISENLQSSFPAIHKVINVVNFVLLRSEE